MAYLGNTPTQQGFIPAIDYFSGNASTTAFTLSRPVASVAQVQAVIENVPQNPGDAFTVSGNTITFTSAPPSGTNNIYVYYTSPITQVIQPGQGTVGTAQIQSGVTVSFADGSAAAPSITNTDDSNTGMFFPAADTIAFAEGGAEAMRLTSVGNMGVGTNSPTNILEISRSSDGYWTGSDWNARTPTASVITNTQTGGYDPVLIGRMTDSGGTSKNSYAIGTVGTSSWTAGNNGTQTADMYFAVRNNSGGISEQARITSAGLFRFNSGYGSVATAYGCRAWVNFNGTGTPAIRASGNVSSITDVGTGRYTVNFTTAMPDANYAAVISHEEIDYGGTSFIAGAQATTSISVSAYDIAGGKYQDPDIFNVVIIR
jgi:hypothetical protein